MPTQILKGTTFADGGGPYDAADLNSHVDAATILPGCIEEQAQEAPITTGQFLFRKATGDLRKCSLTQIINAFPADDAVGTPSLRRLGTTSVKAAAGNDTRFPASVTGLRLGAGAGSNDTAAEPKDVSFTPVDLDGETEIDWDAGDMFIDDLAGNKTYTWANRRAGRAITIIIKTNGFTPTMPAFTTSTAIGTGDDYYCFEVKHSALGTIGYKVRFLA